MYCPASAIALDWWLLLGKNDWPSLRNKKKFYSKSIFTRFCHEFSGSREEKDLLMTPSRNKNY